MAVARTLCAATAVARTFCATTAVARMLCAAWLVAPVASNVADAASTATLASLHTSTTAAGTLCPACSSTSPPSLACPFLFYHVPKAAGSSLRHVFYEGARRHNLTAFIPCYGTLPCEVGGDRLETMIACFERQGRHGLDTDDLRTCMARAMRTHGTWGWALVHAKRGGVHLGDAPTLATHVLRHLSCSSVVAAHVTPHLLRRAALLFAHFRGSQTAADVGLCRGLDVACATCWTVVRDPLQRALSHVRHFAPHLLSRWRRLDAQSVLSVIGDNMQAEYVTPAARQQCTVLVYEDLARSRHRLYDLAWLGGAATLPVVNARPVSKRQLRAGVRALERAGVRAALGEDVGVYERVVQEREQERARKESVA